MAAILDSIFKLIFVPENLCIVIQTLLKCITLSPISKKSALIQIMASYKIGNEPTIA